MMRAFDGRDGMRKAQPAQAADAGVWRTARESPGLPGGAFGELLTFDGSLTARLDRLCGGTFALALMAQRRLEAGEAESLFATEPGDWLPALCREVLMFAAGTPVVFARTLIPARTARAQGWLENLGGSSLGHALFVREDVERSPFEFARCPAGGDVDRRMRALLPPGAFDTRVTGGAAAAAGGDAGAVAGAPWARRSRFAVDGEPLLVMEVFLPGVERLAAGAVRERDT
jgi:chorismate--pyruvate lyase